MRIVEKIAKRGMAALLAFIMCVCLLPAAVFAEDTDEIVTAEAVATLNGKSYADLQEAIAAAESGATVMLIADAEVRQPINIEKTVTLDLNGHKVINYISLGRPFVINASNISFTVDGTKDGSGMETDESVTDSYGFIQDNRGTTEENVTIILNGGTYTAHTKDGAAVRLFDTTGVKVTMSDVICTVGDGSITNFNYNCMAEQTITGGTYRSSGQYNAFSTNSDYSKNTFKDVTAISENGAGIVEVSDSSVATFDNCNFTMSGSSAEDWRHYLISASYRGKAIINSGNYVSEGNGVQVFYTNGEIVINGGNFKAEKDVVFFRSQAKDHKDDNEVNIVTINGGTFEGGFGKYQDYNANLVINGGTFINDFNEEAAKDFVTVNEDLHLVQNDDGSYSVLGPVAKIGDKYYNTLQEAMDAAQAGDTVTILAGTYEAFETPKKENITIVGETDEDGKNLVTINTLTAAAPTGSKGGIVPKGKYLTLQNLDLVSWGEAPANGSLEWSAAPISFGGADYGLTIDSCSIVYKGQPDGNNNIGMCVCTGLLTIKDSVIDGFKKGCYNLCDNYWAQLTVTGNTFKNCREAYNDYYSKATPEDEESFVRVTNNKFENVEYFTIWDDNLLQNNGKALKANTSINKVTVEGNDFNGTKFVMVEFAADRPGSTDEIQSDVEVVKAMNDSKLEPVAKVGSVSYADLQTAIDAAEKGATVTLLKDIDLEITADTEKGYMIDKDLTLDLNGKTLSQSGDATPKYVMGLLQVKNGKLTLRDTAEVKGCINDNATNYSRTQAIMVYAGAEVVVEEGVTVFGRAYVLGVTTATSEGGAKLTVNGTIDTTGKLKSGYRLQAIMGNGSVHGTNITVTGTLKAEGIAVYHPQLGTLTIDGGYVEGYAAIGIKSGNLNIINGASVVGRQDDTGLSDANSAASGIAYDGSAIVIDSCIGYAGQMNITIENSTVKSLYSNAIREIQSPGMTGTNVVSLNIGGMSFIDGGIEIKEATTATITGGKLSDEPDAETIIPDGCKVYNGKDGYFYIVTDFTMTAAADKAEVKAGEEVTVTVAATGASYTNADWKLRYDPTKLELISSKLIEGADEVNAEAYTLAGKIGNVGSSEGDEIASGAVLATYTFKAVAQTTSPVTTAVEFIDAHVNTYDMAMQLTNVEAATENADVTIVIDETASIPGKLEKLSAVYDGKAHMSNPFVASESGVVVTYSTEENGNYTTALPTFTKVGSYDVWYKAEIAGYNTKTVKVEGAVVIEPKAVTAGVEFAAGATYPEVVIRPTINGVDDRTYTGTVTVVIDGQTFTFNAEDFVFVNGMAVLAADKAKTVTLSRGGEFEVSASYTAGTEDNYKGGDTTITTVNVDLAFADEATTDALKAAVKSEFAYDGTEHGVVVADGLPSGWTVKSIEAIGGTANPTVTNVADGSVFVQVIFTDGEGRYNNVTVNTVLAVTPADVTIKVGTFAKDYGTADDTITVKSGSFSVQTDGLIVATDLGTITAVRAELGEERGSYAMTASYTPNSNYNVTVVNGKLEIGAPKYLVEVVDNNLIHGGDVNSDYVAGYKLILVYTDADRAYFTYGAKPMYDVTERGYKYTDYSTGVAVTSDTAYRHVFGIVVKADGSDYANKINYTTDALANPERIVYDMDVNLDGVYSANDYSAANGVYNALYADIFAKNMLKADADGNKYVDTTDVERVKARVENR